MARLELTRITKKFDQTTAVYDFNLDVADGEFITLLGPSGCGKTTTLRMIAGFILPTSGEIRLGDQLISSTEQRIYLPPEGRNMGMVFQSYAVWPHKNVFENIAYPLRLRRAHRNDIRQRVHEALDLVNLDGLHDRFPHQLSGGQQQRVALARALVMEPEVLLLDEPLSNLDAKLRERMRLEIMELQQRLDITVVYVTHDQEEAMAMSDRVVVLREGIIQQIDTPETIYNHPTNRFVAEFIGAANFIAGRVQHKSETQIVVCPDVSPNTPIDVSLGNTPPPVDGQTVQLVVRPEHVALTSADETSLAGVVQQRVFLGRSIEYRVQVKDITLRVEAAAGQTFSIGDEVGIQILHGTLVSDD